MAIRMRQDNITFYWQRLGDVHLRTHILTVRVNGIIYLKSIENVRSILAKNCYVKEFYE